MEVPLVMQVTGDKIEGLKSDEYGQDSKRKWCKTKSPCNQRWLVNICMLHMSWASRQTTVERTNLPSTMPSNDTSTCKITTQHINIPLVHRWTDVIELGDEGMFQPIYDHFWHQHRHDRLINWEMQYSAEGTNTYVWNGPKNIAPEPSKAFRHYEPTREVEFRAAELDQVAECNDEKHERQCETLDNVCAGDLKKVVFFELLEYASLDLDELIGNEESEKGMIIRVDSNVQR
jgi:hypothetical protein